jgi:type II secretory pathway component PulK
MKAGGPNPSAMRAKSERGMALALVLAGLVILSLITIALLSRAGRDVDAGNAIVERARATALVEGAIETTIVNLFAPDARRRLRAADGELVVQLAGTPVTTRVRDACGLWDINHGDVDILSMLLIQLGAADTRLTIDALRTAREVDAGLLSKAQVRALPGMNSALYGHLGRDITVNCRADRIDPDFASATLLAAVPGLTSSQIAAIIEQRRVGPIDPGLLASFAAYLSPGPGHTYEIVASKGFGPGSRVTRRAEVTLTYQPHQPYRILSWSNAE